MTDEAGAQNEVRTLTGRLAEAGYPGRPVQFVDISKCNRCGKDHHNLCMYRFTRPIVDRGGAGQVETEWTHWSFCPEVGDPILIRIAPK